MLKIRLTRMGDKHTPVYRVVVVDGRSARDAAYIENLGTYNPMVTPGEIKIDAAKAKEWIAKGAQPTDTARAILVKAGAIAKPKKAAPKTAKPKKKENKKK